MTYGLYRRPCQRTILTFRHKFARHLTLCSAVFFGNLGPLQGSRRPPPPANHSSAAGISFAFGKFPSSDMLDSNAARRESAAVGIRISTNLRCIKRRPVLDTPPSLLSSQPPPSPSSALLFSPLLRPLGHRFLSSSTLASHYFIMAYHRITTRPLRHLRRLTSPLLFSDPFHPYAHTLYHTPLAYLCVSDDLLLVLSSPWLSRLSCALVDIPLALALSTVSTFAFRFRS